MTAWETTHGPNGPAEATIQHSHTQQADAPLSAATEASGTPAAPSAPDAVAESPAAASTAEPGEQPPAEPAPKPTRILLIRHGSNDYVKKGLLAGRTPDVHLNEYGQSQAAGLAARLAGETLAAIYSSPLERCQETAAPLAGQLNLELRVLEDVKESDCGDWTGQALEELRKAETWPQVQMNPSSFRFPNGESIFEIQARMVSALERLRQQHIGETIAVFSHSDPIKVALSYYLGAPLDLFQRLEISPASISELEFAPMRVRVIRMNDCAHVPAPPPEEPATTDSPVAAQLGPASDGPAEQNVTEDSPAAKGALEEQVIRGPHGAGPEPDALQVADEGKMQATGG